MADSNDILLDLNKVSREFGGDVSIQALTDIDLKVYHGDWLAITGPSGAGKSTLLNILGCLDRLSSGSYFFEGIDTSTLTDRQRAGLRSQHVGFVFQSFHLLPHRTVLENVMMSEVYRNGSQKGRAERAQAAIARVGLSHRIDYSPSKLSGGERQRVAIARAIIGSPSLLFCDEPTGNLDSKSTASILDLFQTLNQQGLTLVVVTHDETVAKRATRRVQIVDGRLTDVTAISQVSNYKDSPLPSDRAAPSTSIDSAPKASDPKTMEKAKTGLRSGITLRDLLNEALAGMFARPGRMALTILGIVIGLTALVATMGLSRTASNRIISQFDELAATGIVITAKPGPTGVDPKVIPWNAAAQLARLNGVVAAGTLSEVPIGNALVSTSPVKDPQSQTAFKLAMKAASPGLFTAVRAELAIGRFPDLGHSQRMERVAVLGPSAALRLGIANLERLPAIAIGDHIYLVIGILKNVGRQADLLGSVIIPEGTARNDFNLIGPGAVVVETRIGATSLIVKQAAVAVRPDNPKLLRLEFPPEPQRVRDAVQGDLNVLFLLLGGLSLIVGAIGIGNITLVSVIERTGEIGLRRAIGATRGHIASQFLLESASMGVIGGILGASLGVFIVVGVSAYQLWTPVLDPSAPFLAPLVGGSIGILSGLYPAMRAARMEPVEAFRN